ncbi:MAG: HIT family protein [Flavobacteriales bacterium]|jgi:histidine triad (HIT) family protein|nr:HIT family protein [Flavobacteriales bacterium]
MPSVFTRIIQKELPAYIIAENESCIAFLDISPLQRGHTLVVPKREVDKLFDLPEKDYHALLSFARKIALAIGNSVECNRVGMTVIGLEVPHAHIHLIPIQRESDMNFASPKLHLGKAEFELIAEEIRMHLTT